MDRRQRAGAQYANGHVARRGFGASGWGDPIQVQTQHIPYDTDSLRARSRARTRKPLHDIDTQRSHSAHSAKYTENNYLSYLAQKPGPQKIPVERVRSHTPPPPPPAPMSLPSENSPEAPKKALESVDGNWMLKSDGVKRGRQASIKSHNDIVSERVTQSSSGETRRTDPHVARKQSLGGGGTLNTNISSHRRGSSGSGETRYIVRSNIPSSPEIPMSLNQQVPPPRRDRYAQYNSLPRTRNVPLSPDTYVPAPAQQKRMQSPPSYKSVVGQSRLGGGAATVYSTYPEEIHTLPRTPRSPHSPGVFHNPAPQSSTLNRMYVKKHTVMRTPSHASQTSSMWAPIERARRIQAQPQLRQRSSSVPDLTGSGLDFSNHNSIPSASPPPAPDYHSYTLPHKRSDGQIVYQGPMLRVKVPRYSVVKDDNMQKFRLSLLRYNSEPNLLEELDTMMATSPSPPLSSTQGNAFPMPDSASVYSYYSYRER